MRRLAVLAAVLTAALLLALPAGARTSGVALKDFAFRPGTITVPKNRTIRWTNRDGTGHNVTVSRGPRKFHSKLFGHNKSYSHRFATRGTYHIECTIHPGMAMTVKVR